MDTNRCALHVRDSARMPVARMVESQIMANLVGLRDARTGDPVTAETLVKVAAEAAEHHHLCRVAAELTALAVAGAR